MRAAWRQGTPKWPIRTRLDLLKPNCGTHVRDKQPDHKQHHDQHSRKRVFTFGQPVYARNFRDGPAWVHGTILSRQGPRSFLVRVMEGMTWKCHLDHLRLRQPHKEGEGGVPVEDQVCLTDTDDMVVPPDVTTSDCAASATTECETETERESPNRDTGDGNLPGVSNETNTQARRYPQRDRAHPQCYSHEST